MLALATTIVLGTFISCISGQKLEFMEDSKICTGWQYVSGGQIQIDTTVCESSLDYELRSYNSMYLVRFCCIHKSTVAGGGCGRQAVLPLRTRIVGGQEAVPHSWPWLVSLQFNGHHFCGGTLIDEYHVLTAAHCLQDQNMLSSGFSVVAGLHTRSQPHPTRSQRKTVSKVVNHPAYNGITSENDVAIIRLSSPVQLNSYVQFACLPGKEPTLNENVMIAGWGTTSFGGSPPDSLHQAAVLIMNTCQYVYNFDEKKQICAGNYQYSKDSCQGDSGGPLMNEVGGQWFVSGVVSYGDECAKKDYPGVYARVSYYLPWIRSVVSALSG